MRRSVMLLILPLCLLLLVANVDAKPKSNFHSHIRLTAVGADTDASGFVDLSKKEKKNHSEQNLHLKVERLASNTSFLLVVNGVVITTLTTNAGGTFEVKFSSRPRGNIQPLPLLITSVTAITQVQIQTLTGQVLLDGWLENNVEQEILLTATGIDADARGEAEIEFEKEANGSVEQEFEVEVKNLAANTSFRLFVNGSEVAILTTNSSGEAEIEFSSNTESDDDNDEGDDDQDNDERPLPASLNPVTNIRLVEIRTMDGSLVLSGTFSATL